MISVFIDHSIYNSITMNPGFRIFRADDSWIVLVNNLAFLDHSIYNRQNLFVRRSGETRGKPDWPAMCRA